METKVFELGAIYKINKDKENKLGPYFVGKEIEYIGEFDKNNKYVRCILNEDISFTLDSKKILIKEGTEFIVLKDNLVFERYKKVIFPKDLKIKVFSVKENKNTMFFTLLKETKKLEALDKEQQRLGVKGKTDKENTLSKKIKENREKLSKLMNQELKVRASRTVGKKLLEVEIPMPTVEVVQNGVTIVKKDLKAIKLKAHQALNKKLREQRLAVKSSPTKKETRFGAIELYNGVAQTNGQYLKMYEHIQKNLINDEKKPYNNDSFIGIEIELISKSDVGKLKEVLIKNKLQKWTNVTSDGSLRTSDGYPFTHEIRVLVPENNRIEILNRLGVALQEAQCSVNNSCGLHVHFDMRKRDVAIAFHNLVKLQKFLVESQPEQRRSNTYCRPTESPNIEDYQYKANMTSGGRRSDRYLVINPMSYARHKTLEIRVHEGTVDTDDMLNWINFILPIVNATSKLESSPRKVETIPNYIEGIPSQSLDYINNRILKFA
jgi:hypothetical protein